MYISPYVCIGNLRDSISCQKHLAYTWAMSKIQKSSLNAFFIVVFNETFKVKDQLDTVLIKKILSNHIYFLTKKIFLYKDSSRGSKQFIMVIWLFSVCLIPQRACIQSQKWQYTNTSYRIHKYVIQIIINMKKGVIADFYISSVLSM